MTLFWMIILSFLLLLNSSIVSGLRHTCNTNVAYYWGQNSVGGSDTQMNLSNYTEDNHGDIFIISFVHVFFGKGGVPSMDIVHSCDEGTNFPGTELLYCPQLGNDILASQQKGKKVILSLGGATGEYGFTNDTQAIEFADQVWNVFGNGLSATRPFGDAVVDGFDLDIEQGNGKGYSAFVKRLRSHFTYDTTKNYIITAAPQCPLPDKYLTRALRNSHLDMLFIQYYNNGCGVTGWKNAGIVDEDKFNFQDWDDYVREYSKNPDIKLYLGVPGGKTAAKKGYANPFRVLRVSSYLQRRFPRFGGIMVWDASEAWLNKQEDGRHFAEVIKEGLVTDGGCQIDQGGTAHPLAPIPKPRRRQPWVKYPRISGITGELLPNQIEDEEYEIDSNDLYYQDMEISAEDADEFDDDDEASEVGLLPDEDFFDFSRDYAIFDKEELGIYDMDESEEEDDDASHLNSTSYLPYPTQTLFSSIFENRATTTTIRTTNINAFIVTIIIHVSIELAYIFK